MKKIFKNLIIILAIFLVSSGGVQAQNQPRKVVCLGDSITVGYAPKFRTPDGLTCTSNARVGRPTSEMVSEWRSNIRGRGFTDLILMGGTNDMASDRDAERAIANLGTIYTEAKAEGIRVVAVTITPFAGLTRYGTYRSDPNGTQARIDRLNTFVRGSGMDMMVDAYVALGDPARPTFLNPIYDSGDGIHPSEPAGRQFLAQTISAQGFGGAPAAAGAPQLTPSRDIITPNLGINIPDVELAQGAEQNGFLSLPFLGNYIAGLVRYLMGAAGVLAGIMVTIGGLQYLLAAGNKSAIDTALKRIKNALFGLTLALGSYLILYTISPQIVTFRALRLEAVQQAILSVREENGGLNYGGDTSYGPGERPRISRGSMDPTYDAVFQKYAGCAGIDWRILKAIAYKESSFDESVTNRYGFTGLFQTKARFCPLSLYGRGADCQNLTNPDNNTASAVVALASATSIIRNRCPNIDTQNFVTLLYISHNSGVGAMRNVINNPVGGCTGNFESALASFWSARSTRVTNGGARASYARAVARQALGYGVQNPFAEGECPLIVQ